MLVAILALGFALRAYRVVEPLGTPGDDAHAYYALVQVAVRGRQLRGTAVRRPERLVARRPAALRRSLLRDRRRPRRHGADRRAAARPGGDPRRLPARQEDLLPPGGPVGGLRGRRLPALHPLDGSPLQRAAGDLHPAGGRARLPLGGRTGTSAGLAPARRPLRPDRADPSRVPAGRRRLRRPRRDPGRPRREAGVPASPGDRALRARPAAADRPLDDAQPGRPRTARCRSRPAAARHSTSAPSFPPTANTTGSRRSLLRALPATSICRRTPKRSNRVDPTPLFDRVAARYPDLPRDSALGKIGKQNFSRYFGEDPVGYAAMTARKVWRMWSARDRRSDGIDRRPGPAGDPGPARPRRPRGARRGADGGGSWSRWRRRSSSSRVVGAASLAAPRRNEILMTLVFPLAGAALARGGAALSSGRPWSPRQASSPQS